jgi:hypothetical protein
MTQFLIIACAEATNLLAIEKKTVKNDRNTKTKLANKNPAGPGGGGI